MVAQPDPAAIESGAGERVRASDPRYWELSEFLMDEAELLDQGRLLEWHALMAPELRYQVPVRITRRRDDGSPFSTRMFHADETFISLGIKAQRLVGTTSAWAEDPPSRTRRFVTSVRVADLGDIFDVRSNLLLVRFRHDHPTPELVSAERRDSIRRRDEAFEIVRRTVYLDLTTLGTPNLAVFL